MTTKMDDAEALLTIKNAKAGLDGVIAPRAGRQEGGERILPVYAPPSGTIGVWSRAMTSIPGLEAFLGAPVRFRPRLPDSRHLGNVEALAGWGHTPAADKVRALAESRNLPFLALDYGFLRSLSPYGGDVPSCSMVVDSSGMYDDATRPSDLENLLNDTGWETPELLAEARHAMDAIRRNGLSKYNHAPDAPPFLLTTPGKRLRVLLIDQAADQRALARGMASVNSFAVMLERAHADHPGAALFVKPHPTVLSGKKHGCLTALADLHGATILDRDVSPLSLLAQADEVYTVTSQMGFEALMLGKPVHCFGLPFYAGWGLTEDERRCLRRTRRRTVEEVFAAAYLLYSRYVNPVTGKPCAIHDAIRLLALQRAHNERNSGYAACLKFSRNQRAAAQNILASTRGSVRFFHNDAHAVQHAKQHKGAVIVWANHSSPALEHLCAEQQTPLTLLDEGFLRTARPDEKRQLSLVRDAEGIYYDATRPSTLENILLKLSFERQRDSALLIRAAELRKRLMEQGLCSCGPAAPQQHAVGNDIQVSLLPPDAKKRILLVPGEASDEAFALFGGQGIQSHQDLLRSVRAANPDAYILFVPHPGTNCGNRHGISAEIACADAVASGENIQNLYPLVHEVHTQASLAGFEALLRGIPVHTYGGPFYAGWGLTTDKQLFPRRTRPLTIDMLVAGALILYPTYYDWDSRQICGPEEACEPHRPRRPAWRRLLGRILRRTGR